MMISVEIVCVGDADPEVLDFVSTGLGRELGAEVARACSMPVPPETFNTERGQYSSSQILTLALREWRGLTPERGGARVAPGTVLLAVASVDLYVPELNFVFGQALPAEGACIMSLARLGTSLEGRPVPEPLLKERALKEAVHEIGHLLGLGHCGQRDCVMFFSNSIRDTDAKSSGFCTICRRLLQPA